jgi:hypothetical protein
MRKIVVAMSLAVSYAMCASAFAARTADEIIARGFEIRKSHAAGADTTKALNDYAASLTKDEMRAVVYREIELLKSGQQKWSMYTPFNILGKWLRAECSDMKEDVDEKLLSIDGRIVNPLLTYDTIPRTSEKILNMKDQEVDWLEQYPVSVRTARKYSSGLFWAVASFPEISNIVAEHYCFGRIERYMGANSKNRLVSLAAKAVKRRIREQGGSFVVGSDGKNPVQNAVDELSAALNAPRMAGLKEWVGKWFPEYEWIEPKWMTDEEVQKLKDEILYGEKDFSRISKAKLESHLGIEAYNDFVRMYNGTVK